MAPIPITIITGFLGSGKTTLILNLIPQLRSANPEYKLALLKNEFGDVAVDSKLASEGSISGVKEILNGCICCNLVGGLGPALKELGELVRPDRIVVETSGSAFPATLALEVNRLARETGDYVLDGVVSVIDVENWKGYEDTSYTAKIQARYTDLIVFNKWELCDERRFDECLDRVGDLEIEVAWVKSQKGSVPMDVVFGVDGALARRLAADHAPHDHEHQHEHEHDHQDEVQVMSLTLTGPAGSAVDAEKLLAFLKLPPKDEVYRIKGIVKASTALRSSDEDADIPTPPHSENRYILNWAFGRWTFIPTSQDIGAGGSASENTHLRMTMILARQNASTWWRKIESGRHIELRGDDRGQLTKEIIRPG